MTQIPESELGALGEVVGKDILEIGCGAAQWSIALAGLGARPVGIDLSERQLAHARTWIRLFRANGFVVEDLIEPRPGPEATSTYRDAHELDWARRWPAEEIWRLRRT